MVIKSKTIPALRRELFVRVLVLLLSIQIFFLSAGMFAAWWVVRSKNQQELVNSANKAVELYGVLARYGDVRYARFVVLSNSEQSGLRIFRVFDFQGEEIQAANPMQTLRAPDDVMRAATKVRASMPQDGKYHAAMIAETVAGEHASFSYAIRTTDGADYILALTMLNQSGMSWLLVIAIATAGILISSLLALVLARSRTAATVRTIESYAENVRAIPHLQASNFSAPYEELVPIHTALTDMVGELREKAKYVAIAQTTQMFAHDVRKPFSILRMGLNLLDSAPNSDAVKNILRRLVPEVEKAVEQVDGLISDVMEIGSPAPSYSPESMTPEALIEASVSGIGRMFPQAKIHLSYNLGHNHQVLVHPRKVGRVFSNILTNAIQALGQSDLGREGQVWFRTRDVNGFVEFCIGNSGSLIPPENLSKLFDAFFTCGKRAGTGLGLAIAQKVITEHSGKIWCQSSRSAAYPDGQVEFYFTLPAVGESTHLGSCTTLPQNTMELAEHFPTTFPGLLAAENPNSHNARDRAWATNTVSSTNHTAKPTELLSTTPEIAVVEDNPFILEAWVKTLSQEAIVHAAPSPEVLSRILLNDAELLQRLTCVVTDLHFDNSTLNGLDVGKMIKQRCPQLPVLLSSDGWLSAAEMTEAIDQVIPKEALAYRRLRDFF